MMLTPHPFQRAGARAAAVMAGVDTPEDLTEPHLERVVDIIVSDVLTAARTSKGEPGWAWYMMLASCYPNSPATHHKRISIDDAELERRLRALFVADEDPGEPCAWCGGNASVQWGKSLWPLADSGQYVGTQPAGGIWVCRDCRIAGWCLPYASRAQTGRQMAVMTVVSGDDRLERDIVAAHVAYNRATIDTGRRRWSRRTWPQHQVWQALLAHPGPLEILVWNNDNRGSDLKIWYVTPGVAEWVARLTLRQRAGLLRVAGHLRWHPLTLLATTGDPGDDWDRIEHAARQYATVVADSGDPDWYGLHLVVEMAMSWRQYRRGVAPAEIVTEPEIAPPPGADAEELADA